MVSVGSACAAAEARGVLACTARQPQFSRAAACGESGVELNVSRRRRPWARCNSLELSMPLRSDGRAQRRVLAHCSRSTCCVQLHGRAQRRVRVHRTARAVHTVHVSGRGLRGARLPVHARPRSPPGALLPALPLPPLRARLPRPDSRRALDAVS